MRIWVLVSLWNSSGKSQKPLYSKLENYPETQNKSPNSFLRLLPSYTSTEVVSGVSSKGRAFFLSGEYCEETFLLVTDKLVSVTARLRSLRSDDPSSKGNPRSVVRV